MITVRKGVFETNSSSMHSICVMKNKGKYTDEDFWIDMYVWQDGELVLGGLEFERAPFRLLTTFKEKLEYAIASLCGNEEREAADDQFRKIESLVHKIEPKIESIKLHKIFTLADNEQLIMKGIYMIYIVREFIRMTMVTLSGMIRKTIKKNTCLMRTPLIGIEIMVMQIINL